ncbi:MAG: polysaccharide biosynthesis tyrosine autokinase [Lachnospiraceae bacterium]|nr:polysaccharide biosynthesis tyrosine autokinase [Lachnospiraceae bacterium]
MNERMKQASEEGSSSLLHELDYFTILKDVAKNWWVILLTGLTAMLLVNLLPYIGYKPMYTAESTLIVTGTARNGDSFSTYSSNAESFVSILTDEYILQEVAEDMGLKKLDVEVKAEIIAETNLLDLSVRSNKPTTSYRVLKGLLEHYQDISEMMYPGYILDELAPAQYPSSPDNIYSVKELSRKAVILSMIAMVLVIALFSFFFDSVKNEKDVEKKLDTELYAAIYHERKYKTLRMLLKRKKGKKEALLISSPVASFGFVETYKRLREKIVIRCKRSGKKVIMVTSMLENEGKSTVAANLALGLAAVSERVVLLDADLRKPAQHKIFEHRDSNQGSLSGYLAGVEPLKECLVRDEETGIYMMYDKRSNMDSSEVIGNERMKELIEQLREKADYVVVDTPPMDMVADAETIASLADYSLLVISPDNAPTKAVNDCIDQLYDCRATLLGCILNNIYTVSLLVQQATGFHPSVSVSSKKYGAYNSSYSYGYGYGKKEGYGKAADETRKKRKSRSVNVRETASAEEFFIPLAQIERDKTDAGKEGQS